MITMQRGSAAPVQLIAHNAPLPEIIASPVNCLNPGLIIAAALRLRDETGWAIAGAIIWLQETAVAGNALRPAMDFLARHKLADVIYRGSEILVRVTEKGINALDYAISAYAVLRRFEEHSATLAGVADYPFEPSDADRYDRKQAAI